MWAIAYARAPLEKFFGHGVRPWGLSTYSAYRHVQYASPHRSPAKAKELIRKKAVPAGLSDENRKKII